MSCHVCHVTCHVMLHFMTCYMTYLVCMYMIFIYDTCLKKKIVQKDMLLATSLISNLSLSCIYVTCHMSCIYVTYHMSCNLTCHVTFCDTYSPNLLLLINLIWNYTLCRMSCDMSCISCDMSYISCDMSCIYVT